MGVVEFHVRHDFALGGARPSRHNVLPKLLLLSGGFFAAALLGAVLATALFAILDAIRVECATHDVVADTRQVFHTTTTDQHNAVFLEPMPFAGNVSRNFNPIAE